MNHAVSPLDNPMKIKVTRKDIARMQTEVRKRQLSDIKK
jgi:large subunit ribosomal protein L29